MPNADAIRWFKSQFHEPIAAAVEGTPFTLDLLTAIACQETGHIWNILRSKVNTAEVLALCVGDTLDEDKGRRAFPRTRAELLAKPNGQEMFDIARKALVEMAQFIPGFKGAASRPGKFCHGFGIFQYDLQFFLQDPDYFLQKRYARFDASLAKAIEELKSKQKKIGLADRTALTDLEMAAVAIAYNTGGFKPAKGLKQGHFDGTRHYGEAVFDFLRLSKTVAVEGVTAGRLPSPAPGTAPLPPPTPVTATGSFFEVEVLETPLNVRREALIPPRNGASNVIAKLPDGQVVRAVTGKKRNGFMEVETSLNGAFIRGFAFAKFLKPAPAAAEVAVEAPAAAPPTTGLTAVLMPLRAGIVTKRAAPATAHSLNEAGQPGRKGETADARRAELAGIIDWLAVDKPSHKRYQPRGGITFCNIYVHDYCHLAGCYLPRVWWSPAAIEALAQGRTVLPLLGRTIDEQRANDLYRWLRDFGLRFGWRQTGTPTKLQTEANQGAIALIVARRVTDGVSGHVVVVAPETADHQARRNSAGEVVAPLQSQAGVTNFRYGTGKVDWWKDPKFAEFAFWLHA
jgi:hypothetical protein